VVIEIFMKSSDSDSVILLLIMDLSKFGFTSTKRNKDDSDIEGNYFGYY
jgi:hypothetical protein